MSEWPGAHRRNPSPGWPTYAVRAPLSAWMRAEAARTPPGARVLDVGCGLKPYYPWFAERASEYVGVDIVESPYADLQGTAEALPVPDATFDLVLCLQVLEHTADPAQVVRELRRVTAPGGRVLASTHGVHVYHPSPDDFWRWTRAGLERLFREHADWSSVAVSPAGGSAACVGMLVSIYIRLLAQRARMEPASRALVALINRTAAALDRRTPRLREPQPGTIAANYHVVAEVSTS